jgi:SSS family solute:Na+ symporter
MYRGLWGTLVMIAVLYVVSWFTKKTDPDKLDKTTVRWDAQREPFAGLSDWRLQLAVLAAVNVSIYVWLW